VIVAAGEGRRFGGERKQFADLGGKPLLLRTVEPFRGHPLIDGISVVVPEDVARQPPAWLALLASEGVRLVAGGATRTDSVRLGLASVPEDVALVAVHDGARPLISRDDIGRVLVEVREDRGAVAGRRVADSLKETEASGRVVRTVGRERLWRAETPQAFSREVLIRVHERAQADGVTASDCAGLCERYGVTVVMVELEEPNPKITRAADLDLAEAWIRAQRERGVEHRRG